MGGRGDWYEWTTRLGAKQLSATLLKIMIYCDFGKHSFERGFREGQIQNDFMPFNLQSRSYLEFAALIRYAGLPYLLNKLSRWMFEGFLHGFL